MNRRSWLQGLALFGAASATAISRVARAAAGSAGAAKPIVLYCDLAIDPKREQNAIAEAMRLGIPIMAMVDTNCDPDQMDYPIPSNDDAIRSIRVIINRIANAALEGRGISGAEGLSFEEMLDAPPAVDSAAVKASPAAETAGADESENTEKVPTQA